MNVLRRRQLGMHRPQNAPAYMGKIRVTESKRLLAKKNFVSGAVLLRQCQQPPVGGVGSVKHRVGRGFRILRPQGDPELLCLGKQHIQEFHLIAGKAFKFIQKQQSAFKMLIPGTEGGCLCNIRQTVLIALLPELPVVIPVQHRQIRRLIPEPASSLAVCSSSASGEMLPRRSSVMALAAAS